MAFDPKRAYGLLLRLSFPRFTGTAGANRARDMILEELSRYGYDARAEEFEVDVFSVEKAELEITEPPLGRVDCQGVGFSGSTAPEGIEGGFYYAEAGDRRLVPKDEGAILLLASRPDLDTWKFLTTVGVSGLVVSEQTPDRELSHIGVPVDWKRYGSIPMVMVRFEDAIRLVKSGASRARLTLLQEERKTKAYNVVAEKAGNKYPDEIVIVCSHYDSVSGVPGATDNAGGVAATLELARIFSEKDLKRTVRFVLFSGEELGLLGSREYVRRHEDEIERIKLVVNLDVHGGAIGTLSSIITGPEVIRDYLEALSKELGIRMRTSKDIMSSDGTSFAYKNVPALNFFRSSGTGRDVHTILDDTRFTWYTGFESVGLIAETLLNRILNAEEFPLPREIPEDVKKKVKEYFEKRLGVSRD